MVHRCIGKSTYVSSEICMCMPISPFAWVHLILIYIFTPYDSASKQEIVIAPAVAPPFVPGSVFHESGEKLPRELSWLPFGSTRILVGIRCNNH